MATKQSLIRYYQQILDKNAKEQDQTSIESASSILIKEFIEKLQELQPTLADEELVEAIMQEAREYTQKHKNLYLSRLRPILTKHLLKQSKRETMEIVEEKSSK